jgi:protein-S-isoprenylcysteine O-methyltransferase Ste14
VRRARAAIGTGVFLGLASGVEAGLGPWLLTQWETGDGGLAAAPLRIVGVVLIAAGLGVLLHTFWRFVAEGVGTPTPLAPPERLVVGGVYRYVRNPMYVATAAVIAGQGLLLAQPVLLAGAAAYLATFALFVRRHEEPLLARRFGAQYDAYRRAVPGWWPRLRPWQADREPATTRATVAPNDAREES